MKPILSIGDLVADIVVSIPNLPAEAGRHQVASELRLEPGGGANFLIAGARLGQPMAALGALGDDTWGWQVADILHAESIDLAGVSHNGATTVVIVLVGQQGDHVFLGKYGHGGKIDFSPAAAALVEQAGAVYCAGYTLCEARLVELALAALRHARQMGVPVYFDPGPQMAAVPATVRDALLPLVDVLLATEDELPLVVSGGAVAGVLAAGPQLLVLKRGPAGCALYAANGLLLESPGLAVPVMDTSAAGDSFNAAFIAGRLRGWPLADCARLANAVGAAKVQKLGGGRSVPTLAEVRQVLAQFSLSLPETL